ncbi:MAG: serine/threonine-protein phosphatase, partial [Myxococcota bacterium]|nr:serine/threonine-protein phosphatase [Myxococcota bacterium]
VQALGATGETGVRALFDALHRQLARTRGAAISLACLERSGALSWAGVGNVEAVAVAPDGKARRLATGNGIVGQRMGPLYPQQFSLEPDTTLLWVTDGVGEDFLEDFRPLLPTASVPGWILDRHALGSDDALVLALRYRPGGTAP